MLSPMPSMSSFDSLTCCTTMSAPASKCIDPYTWDESLRGECANPNHVSHELFITSIILFTDLLSVRSPKPARLIESNTTSFTSNSDTESSMFSRISSSVLPRALSVSRGVSAGMPSDVLMLSSLRCRLSADRSRFTKRTVPCSTGNSVLMLFSTHTLMVRATYDLPLPGGPNRIVPPPRMMYGFSRKLGASRSDSGTRYAAFCVLSQTE